MSPFQISGRVEPRPYCLKPCTYALTFCRTALVSIRWSRANDQQRCTLVRVIRAIRGVLDATRLTLHTSAPQPMTRWSSSGNCRRGPPQSRECRSGFWLIVRDDQLRQYPCGLLGDHDDLLSCLLQLRRPASPHPPSHLGAAHFFLSRTSGKPCRDVTVLHRWILHPVQWRLFLAIREDASTRRSLSEATS
jgi:hypothetical protein